MVRSFDSSEIDLIKQNLKSVRVSSEGNIVTGKNLVDGTNSNNSVSETLDVSFDELFNEKTTVVKNDIDSEGLNNDFEMDVYDDKFDNNNVIASIDSKEKKLEYLRKNDSNYNVLIESRENAEEKLNVINNELGKYSSELISLLKKSSLSSVDINLVHKYEKEFNKRFDEIKSDYDNYIELQTGYTAQIRVFSEEIKNKDNMYEYLIKYGDEAKDYKPKDYDVTKTEIETSGTLKIVSKDGSKVNRLTQYQEWLSNRKYNLLSLPASVSSENLFYANKQDPMIGNMYMYLFDNVGEEEANQYLKDIELIINKDAGFAKAKEFLEYRNDTFSGFQAFMAGNYSGMNSFGDGIVSSALQTGILSSNDYYKIYLQEMMSDYGGLDKTLFNAGNGFGEVALPLITSIAIPGAGGALTGAVLTGNATFGNTYRECVAKGMDKDKAITIGLQNGVYTAFENLAIFGKGTDFLASTGASPAKLLFGSLGLSLSDQSLKKINELSVTYETRINTGYKLDSYNGDIKDYHRFVFDDLIEENGGFEGILLDVSVSGSINTVFFMGGQYFKNRKLHSELDNGIDIKVGEVKPSTFNDIKENVIDPFLEEPHSGTYNNDGGLSDVVIHHFDNKFSDMVYDLINEFGNKV